MSKQYSIVLGPLICFATFFSMTSMGWENAPAIAAAVTVLCAIWWIFETIPIAATSLIPIAVFPFLGVLSPSQVGQAYGSPIVLLMLGGFLLSVAMEKSQTHKRIALLMINLCGKGSAGGLIAGFMAASAFLSMWISNTATALMLLPIALAVITPIGNKKLNIAVMLGIAYAASLGGSSTPIGTPTNLVFMQVYTETVNKEISFSQWMMIALPITFTMLPIIWWQLSRNIPRQLKAEIFEVGRWRTEEKRMVSIFCITAMLWITRKEPFGGWSEWLGLTTANDASVALLAAISMFLVGDGKKGKLLDWEHAQKIPWGILILFGAGICIAKAFASTGLSETIGEALSGISALPIILAICLLCLCVTFLTEVTSNTATAVLLMPILAATAIAIEIEPALLMVPAVISCSCAFMLPVATPPNAVAYSSKLFTIDQMAKVGVLLNFIGVFIVSLLSYFMINLVLLP